MSLKINDANYIQFKKVYEVIWAHYSKLFPPNLPSHSTPIDILNQWEKKSKSIAKRGLKEGLRDAISSFKEFPPDVLKAIDEDLNKNDLPNIKILQGVIKDAVGKVIKQQKIKTLDEFYIIKELVADLTTNLTEKERSLLGKYMTEFEFLAQKK